MKYRKGIDVSEATEKELLRWHMEKVTKESDEDVAGCANAMASLYSSFENVHAVRFVAFTVFFQLFVNSIVLIHKLLRSQR